jgi:hypothetical protein
MSTALNNVRKLAQLNFVPGIVTGSNSAAAANAATIQAAIDSLASAGSNSSITLPGGVIYSNKIIRRGSVGILGVGETATTLITANGLNDNLVVDDRWENNTAFSQDPFLMADLTLDGNRANNTSGSCYVGQTYWSTFSRVRFQNAASRGVQISAQTKNGTNIGNSVADNRWENCRFFNNAQGGWFGKASTTGAILADQILTGCIFDSNGGASHAQLISERFAGSVLNECRFYSGYAGGDADLTGFAISQVVGCHFELAARSSPNTSSIIASLRIRTHGGPVYAISAIVGNLFWMTSTNKSATDVYCGIYFDQASTALALAGNTFQADAAITTKRAVHGATAMGGTTAGNTFTGYTIGTEYGTAWNSWTRATVGAAATDAATTQTLANNLRTALINAGIVGA